MNKPTLIITGANGFLGRCLLTHFRDRHWSIKAFVHRLPEERYDDITYIKYQMEDEIDSAHFDGVDFLIHAAYLRYEKDARADSINLKGTERLIAVCAQKNIKMAFLSSFSAHENAISHYGSTKLRCEQLFDVTKDVILKIGFVIGRKGILSEMMNRMKNSSFFPLVGGGRQPLQSVYIDDLCRVVENTLDNKELVGIFNVAHHEVVSMKTFYQAVAKRLHRKLIFVPIPTFLLFWSCLFFEKIGVKIPVSSESVLGLKKLITLETEKHQKLIGIDLKSYEESLDLLME